MPNYLSELNINSTDYDLKDKASAKSIDLAFTSSTGVLTGKLKNAANTDISTDTVNLPVCYSSAEISSGKLILTKYDTTQDELTLPSGGGGTSDYDDLTNKPAIGGVTLDKDSTIAGLGLQAEQKEVFYASSLNVSNNGTFTVSDLTFNKFARYFVDVEAYIYSTPYTVRIFLQCSESTMQSLYGSTKLVYETTGATTVTFPTLSEVGLVKESSNTFRVGLVNITALKAFGAII